jgi:hypothetical protein
MIFPSFKTLDLVVDPSSAANSNYMLKIQKFKICEGKIYGRLFRQAAKNLNDRD